MRKLLIAICAAGALFATASYAERRVETLEHFMSPTSALTPAGAAMFVDYKGYAYSTDGVLRVFGAVAAGTEVQDLCEVFQSAHLTEVIREVKLIQGSAIIGIDTCKF